MPEHARPTPAEPAATSAALFELARETMPGGISHRYRWRLPNPLYVDRAEGAYKWDVEGNRYIDYKMGSASQMMGHCHPDIVAALREQAGQLLLAADCHSREIRWSQQICGMIPSAEQVRFVASGTEATMLAIRVARAFTGKPKILRCDGHFHGWHDLVMRGTTAGSDALPSLGVPDEIAGLTLVCAADPDAIEAAFAAHPDIAAIIVEASGANYGAVPMPEAVLPAAQQIADAHGALFILDEIITGFRWSPGGRQALADVRPDMTTLAKIATGGMPGGALAGRREVMAMLDPSVKHGGLAPAVLHQGTFNGAPIVAAAATVMLDLLRDGTAQRQADRVATAIRDGVNGLMAGHGIPGLCYGDSSTFHLYFGPHDGDAARLAPADLRGFDPALAGALKTALNRHGVDLMSAMSGVASAVHDKNDIVATLDAFDRAFWELKRDGLLKA